MPAAAGHDLRVLPGPRLLAGVGEPVGLEHHRYTWAPPPAMTADELAQLTSASRLRGRGGAAFPFARKVSTAHAAGRRRVVVVNAAEGEPASSKDSALILTAAHLVLDGAELTARALGTRTVHVMLPAERPAVEQAARRAIAERTSLRWRVHLTGGTFVGGQSSAVLEAMAGRENLPVTSWAPAAVTGHRDRPTLLSNAETYAQVAVAAALGGPDPLGTAEEPGSTLLTVAGDRPDGCVLEVPIGTPLSSALHQAGFSAQHPLLVGGYHGMWVAPSRVAALDVSRSAMAAAGYALGAGVLLPVPRDRCPVEVTAEIVAYLAGQSAGRCGPCRFGLPALSEAVDALAVAGPSAGAASPVHRITQLIGQVDGRGACAHPDGTARLVRSLLTAFPDEVAAHEHGGCLALAPLR